MVTNTPYKRQHFSSEQKESLSEGREQSKIVRRYLEAIEFSRPRRGRKRTLESITRQLSSIDDSIKTTHPLNRLHLTQKKIELTQELERIKNGPDIGELENQFIRIAMEYSRRKGISFPAWKELGVSQDVLARAGIAPAGRAEKRMPAGRGSQAHRS